MAKVLYVDADHERTKVVCELFVQRGHSVTVESSAERAMLRTEQDAGFEAVVAHLILPSIDGAELCRWLQRWSSMPAVPRIVFSSPAVQIRLNLQHKLPRWLPADVYIHDLEDFAHLVDAVEWTLDRR
jgi:CheY-like chemotaxis protein